VFRVFYNPAGGSHRLLSCCVALYKGIRRLLILEKKKIIPLVKRLILVILIGQWDKTHNLVWDLE